MSQIVLSASQSAVTDAVSPLTAQRTCGAAEVAQDRQVHRVPFVRDAFPVRDDPAAVASGGAEPVVPAGCGDLKGKGPAQRDPVIRGADLRGPARCVHGDRGRVFPPENPPPGPARPESVRRCGPGRSGPTTTVRSSGRGDRAGIRVQPSFPRRVRCAPMPPRPGADPLTAVPGRWAIASRWPTARGPTPGWRATRAGRHLSD